ncbi:uncharacterized protein CBL_02086 [Carabus blaptoides fortunei]
MDKIRLWLPPYYVETSGSCHEELQTLSRNYNECLSIPAETCLRVLNDLQSHAIDKLKERDHFKETGIATLKIRVSNDSSNVQILSVQMRLNTEILELKSKVSQLINIPSIRIKLIANGKVLVDNAYLQDQGVRNGTVVMALVLHENPHEIRDTGNQMKELESVKADTSLLASNSDDMYMNLEDQSGNAINLPAHERKSLMVAMALHEKGRAALKKEDYSTALIMFLDADQEFCHCNSGLLDSVDNYALLNLDIVWCYLCLKSVSQIPEAEERLKKCEQSFHRSYGPNLERLIALKGTPGNEACLFMRLHLLQAIVKYHQNKRDEAVVLLVRAEEELRTLKVDENKLMALVELGFSVAEARLGLRATHGNVDAAAEYINENREQRTKSRKKALEDWILNKERRKLGKCADGKQYVEPKFVKMLQTMGYSKETARLALQQSNNNVSIAVQIIQDNPDLLQVTGSNSCESLTHLITDMIPQLEAAGFDFRMAKLALKKHKGDVMAAVEELIATGGIIEGEKMSDDENTAGPSSVNNENKLKEIEALERLSNAIPMVDDDHLDLNLEQEEIFLNQYKSLLKTE